MYQGQIAVISNKASWWSDVVELVDEDDDGNETVIDLTDPDIGQVSIEVYINDQNGCTRASATTANQKAEIVGPGFQWTFEPSDLSSLCAGTYHCVVRLTLDGFVSDLVLGSVAVLEGR